ncbi:MAG: DNA replication and repair protein RecF [Treponema sp.]|jgi:DNA replication and repair protein RecF|nr:DNA replication and repair protein RecF [Treponema sp.]
MILKTVRTVCFRNLADAETETGEKNIFLVGQNGQGKTNFLEAVYYASYASSFRGVRDSDIARIGEKDFSASVKTAEAACTSVLVKFEEGKKTVFIDGKKSLDRKDLPELVPCIIFCHEDMEFVSGSPERRRWFFDQSLSLYDPVYLEDFRRYRRVLRSRNTLLREAFVHERESMLRTLDLQLVSCGLRLMEKREGAVKLFSQIFEPLYEEVTGIDGISIRYASSWKEKDEDALAAFLLGKREAELAAGVSLSGPHRDRYTFVRNHATEFAGNASTGQRRLLALLLRIAQARRFSDMTGKRPVLLLDDVLLEMDGEKRWKFLSVMPDYDQAFFTFLPEESYEDYKRPGTLVYRVNGGVLFPGTTRGKT